MVSPYYLGRRLYNINESKYKYYYVSAAALCPNPNYFNLLAAHFFAALILT